MSILSRPEAVAPDALRSSRWDHALLVVGHPGHELRVHAWMEAVHPSVCVLTDGSGHTGEGRLASTTKLLGDAGARPGPVYGRMSDGETYQAILAHDHALFCQLADELADVIVASSATVVVGDAAEGYNPCHDVCRLVINAAVRLATRTTGVVVDNFDFALVGAPDGPASADGNVHVELSDEALARKLDAAHGYPEMAREVAMAIERFGVAPFQHEVLRAVDTDDRYAGSALEKPFYEQYGEQRVAEGVYDRVLRFREHVAPVADALWLHSTRA